MQLRIDFLYAALFVETENYVDRKTKQKQNFGIRVNKKTGRQVIWLHDACDFSHTNEITWWYCQYN